MAENYLIRTIICLKLSFIRVDVILLVSAEQNDRATTTATSDSLGTRINFDKGAFQKQEQLPRNAKIRG